MDLTAVAARRHTHVMHDCMRALIVLVVVACGAPTLPAPEPLPVPLPPPTRAAPSPSVSTLAACAAPTVPELASYWDVAMPATYWVDMIAPDNYWQPAKSIPMPPMPYHHATGIELSNQSAFLQPAGQTTPVRFTIEITTRDITKVPDQYEWLTLYCARIIAVCAP